MHVNLFVIARRFLPKQSRSYFLCVLCAFARVPLFLTTSAAIPFDSSLRSDVPDVLIGIIAAIPILCPLRPLREPLFPPHPVPQPPLIRHCEAIFAEAISMLFPLNKKNHSTIRRAAFLVFTPVQMQMKRNPA